MASCCCCSGCSGCPEERGSDLSASVLRLRLRQKGVPWRFSLRFTANHAAKGPRQLLLGDGAAPSTAAAAALKSPLLCQETERVIAVKPSLSSPTLLHLLCCHRFGLSIASIHSKNKKRIDCVRAGGRCPRGGCRRCGCPRPACEQPDAESVLARGFAFLRPRARRAQARVAADEEERRLEAESLRGIHQARAHPCSHTHSCGLFISCSLRAPRLWGCRASRSKGKARFQGPEKTFSGLRVCGDVGCFFTFLGFGFECAWFWASGHEGVTFVAIAHAALAH